MAAPRVTHSSRVSARHVPYSNTALGLRLAFAQLDRHHGDRTESLEWCGAARAWSTANPWGVRADESAVLTDVAGARWISIPDLQRWLTACARVRTTPSVRMLRFLLQSAGIWMRPARLVASAAAPLTYGGRSPADPTVLVEIVDAWTWLRGRFLDRSATMECRWLRRWLGLCRDWPLVERIARTRSDRWCDLAQAALDARLAISSLTRELH